MYQGHSDEVIFNHEEHEGGVSGIDHGIQVIGRWASQTVILETAMGKFRQD